LLESFLSFESGRKCIGITSKNKLWKNEDEQNMKETENIK